MSFVVDPLVEYLSLLLCLLYQVLDIPPIYLPQTAQNTLDLDGTAMGKARNDLGGRESVTHVLLPYNFRDNVERVFPVFHIVSLDGERFLQSLSV